MITKLKILFVNRRVLKDLTVKQLKAKYSGTTLGFSLAVIVPLILALAINFIFTVIFKVRIENFPLFALSAIIPFLFFSNALGESVISIVGNLQLLKQATFPREILPLSNILANFLNFLFGFIVLLPLFIFAQVKVLVVLPFLVIPLILQLIFVLGLGLLLSALTVSFRDLNHLIPVTLMIAFWITPIFYSLDMIPWPYRWICLLNPMTYYVTLYRQILYQAELPNLLMCLGGFLIALASFSIGYIFFVKKESFILKRI